MRIVQSGTIIALIGIIMIVLGVIIFYSIDSSQGIDDSLRSIKHGGTFVGLMGIGVIIAGLLLFLINRNTPSDQKSLEL